MRSRKDVYGSYDELLIMSKFSNVNTDSLHDCLHAVPEDFTSIGAAIDVAEDGDRILVGPGTTCCINVLGKVTLAHI